MICISCWPSVYYFTCSVYASHPNITCSLSAQSPESNKISISLEWFPALYNKYFGKYQILVLPDPNSCSSNNFRPSENYTCKGLSLRQIYNFTLTFSDCLNQVLDAVTFDIQHQGIKIVESDYYYVHTTFSGPLSPTIMYVNIVYRKTKDHSYVYFSITWSHDINVRKC